MERNPATRYPLELFLVVFYVVLDWYFRYVGMTFMAGPWDELLFIFIVGLWILRTAIGGLRPMGSPMLMPILLYCALMVFLFLVQSYHDRVAIEGIRVMLQYIFWFFLAYNLLFSKEQARALVDVFLLVAVVVALYGVFQYFTGVEIPAHWVDSTETTITTRVFSIIGSPNILGSLMVMALPMAFALYISSNRVFKKLVYAAALGILLACLVFTFSRGAWLAFILVAFFLGLWLDRRVIIAMLLLAFLTPALMPTVYDRMTYMISPEYIASSERGGRLGRWEQTMQYWKTSPALGVGLGEHGGAVAARFYPDDSYYVDNWYLKVGAETGWVGLGATLALFILALHYSRRALEETEDPFLRYMGYGILVGLIGVLAHNGVENVFEVPMMASYFWFFLGVIMVLPRLEKDPPVLEIPPEREPAAPPQG